MIVVKIEMEFNQDDYANIPGPGELLHIASEKLKERFDYQLIRVSFEERR